MPHWSDSVITIGNQVLIRRTWTLSDECGNEASSQLQLIAVKDLTPPVLECPEEVTGTAGGANCTYDAGNIPFSVSDNCALADTSYVISGATTASGSGSMQGIPLNVGVTFVALTVTDQAGNTAFCSFTVIVQECQGITGQLIWEGDDVSGVAQATVVLSGDASDTDGPTLPDGLYSLDGSGANLVITPSKPAPPAVPLNGVTAADALAVQQHLMGTTLITDPYKLLAADVNLSNSVTSADASIIRQAVLGSGTALEFFIVKPWRFVPTPDPGPGFPGYIPPPNPFSAPIPESRVLTGVAGPLTNQNFFGIKMGDVNATADPVLHPGSADDLVWLVSDQMLNAGQEMTAVFRASHFKDMGGFQFALHFDPAYLRLLAVEPVSDALGLSLEENFGLYDQAAGNIRCVWVDGLGQSVPEGSPVFTLRFKILQSGVLLRDVLSLSQKDLKAEAYTARQQKTGLRLLFTESTGTPGVPAATAGVQLFQNRPNPFVQTTAVGFNLPAACEAQLRVLDATGRELFRLNKTYPAGYQEEILQLDPDVAPGLLYYELNTPFGQLTRRMVVARR